MFARPNPTVFTDEVRRSRSLHEQLRHDRIVVVVDGNVTVSTRLGLKCSRRSRRVTRIPSAPPSHRVRNVGAESDSAKPLAADRLLLNINRLAIGVVTPDVNRTGTARGPNAVSRYIPIARNHEYIISQRLKIVRDAITRNLATVV